LIAASTLLTHQHHVVDAVTGYGLALIVSRVNLLDLWCRHRESAVQPEAEKRLGDG
jgi:hypothetical protein